MKPDTNFMSLHPFSVTVFEDTIYWSDYGQGDIQSCHKFTGKNHKVVFKSQRIRAYGIQIAHELLQPPYHSPCPTLYSCINYRTWNENQTGPDKCTRY